MLVKPNIIKLQVGVFDKYSPKHFLYSIISVRKRCPLFPNKATYMSWLNYKWRLIKLHKNFRKTNKLRFTMVFNISNDQGTALKKD